MQITTPLLIAASAGVLAGAGGGAVAFAQSQAPIDGDADVHGARLTLEAETPQSTTRVTFFYDGKRIAGRLTETDREDRTKDWAATTRALRSDRPRGAVISFRVRACDSGGCTSARFRERD